MKNAVSCMGYSIFFPLSVLKNNYSKITNKFYHILDLCVYLYNTALHMREWSICWWLIHNVYVCLCGTGVCLVGWANGPSLAVPPGGWSAPPLAAVSLHALQTDTRLQTAALPALTPSQPDCTCSSRTYRHNHHHVQDNSDRHRQT